MCRCDGDCGLVRRNSDWIVDWGIAPSTSSSTVLATRCLGGPLGVSKLLRQVPKPLAGVIHGSQMHARTWTWTGISTGKVVLHRTYRRSLATRMCYCAVGLVLS